MGRTRTTWRPLLPLALLLPGLGCAGTPGRPAPAQHFVLDGTDGGFAVTVLGAGPEALCRAEALRIARAELGRRAAPAPVIHADRMLLAAQPQADGEACLAQLSVSTLPPWDQPVPPPPAADGAGGGGT